MLATLLAAGMAGVSVAVLPPLPHVAQQFVVNVPRKGEDIPRMTNLIVVSEAGHTSTRTKQSICMQIDSSFNAASYAAQCQEDVALAVRTARGVALQHDEPYVKVATALETKLSEQGCYARDFDPPTQLQRPYKANFSFDHGLARHTVPAHDFLDEAFPDRLFLFLGDSAVTLASLQDYYPGTTCDVIYIDGSYTYNGTKADLDAFRKVASPEHTVVLANADLQGESMRAWSDAIAAGAVEWEGTLHESVDRPAGDSLLYGTFQPQRMDAVVPPV